MKQDIHFIGIGGIGMSALAFIMLDKGNRVTGSDLTPSMITQDLIEKGAHITFNQNSKNIKPSHIVVYSTAIKHDNPEFKRAAELGCILIHRADLIRTLSQESESIVVSGAHGKTTTTALLAHIFSIANLDPSYAVGGLCPSLKNHGHLGKGNHFIIEGDESDGSFLKTDPTSAIVTNVDNDHLDFWSSSKALYHAYVSFLLKVKNKDQIVWCRDDEYLSSLNLPGISYGFHAKANVRITDTIKLGTHQRFDIACNGKNYLGIDLSLIGDHNALNAAAVLALSLSYNIPESAIRLGFSTFQGTKRRLECLGTRNGVTLYDDYAHHPKEITSSLLAMQPLVKDKNFVVLFQPHRYSRVKEHFEDFCKSFALADNLIVTDIYSAGEKPGSITTHDLIKAIKRDSGQKVTYIEKDKLDMHLKSTLKKGDILLSMGAGDITKTVHAL